MTRDAPRALPVGPAFAAGAVAVLTVHQAVLWALHARGLAPWPAYARTPTPPFGVPAVASAAFWGGAWGVPLALAVRGAGTSVAYGGRAVLFGAVAPNAVGAVLLALGHGTRPPPEHALTATVSAVVVNGCWALAAAALLRAWSARGPRGGMLSATRGAAGSAPRTARRSSA